ncbi:ABC transporter ATP-binding protein [Bosea sp. BK604]|uniref:ABC transporter ATP-binding protein n=1 Tax=Bosea sp. BK604 TaxID=2512180 RepID=UPI00104692FF|nr:ABC transporter ATP-binding protein [Bosea sp. BK604]TCR70663.1 NitT/TauT family transport system ATP-binding protein [Bosea sp. BK604]
MTVLEAIRTPAAVDRAGASAPAKIEVANVTLRYTRKQDQSESTALDNVSLRVGTGEFLAIVGPSGCGKSTLLKVINGLLRPSEGSVRIDGKPVENVPDGVGFVFQSDGLLPWRTAEENVAIGATLAGRSATDARQRALELLTELGVQRAIGKHPHELSGGMRKRVALARTIAYEPKLYLLDEPFSALDAQTRIHVGNRFIKTLEEIGQTVIIVTHDLEEAIALADRVIVMSAAPGRIAAEFKIDLPRPRDYYQSRFHPDFRRQQQQLWDVLQREMAGELNS